MMKLGMSSYSLFQAINADRMSILDVIQYTADIGGEHIEIVPMGFSLVDNPTLVDDVVAKAKEVGIEISNYAIGADFLQDTEEAYEEEVKRVKKEVDVAHKLGVKLMRHDVSFKPPQEASIGQFAEDAPQLIKACQEIADYAAQYDIVTSIENHGFYVQASDRVKYLVEAVDRENFRTTLDTGNFLCVDEDPLAAVKNNIDIASMVHAKDFYYRASSWPNPGEGWFPTTAGNYLRGAICGHGDINLRDVLKVVKDSGYDGYISIEFEGMETCEQGAKISFDNVREMWENI